MNQYATMIRNLKSPEVMERLMHLYGRRDGMLVEQTGRYIGLLGMKSCFTRTAKC